jgi:poly-gamma-glutamate synthase PgsB/CapB
MQGAELLGLLVAVLFVAGIVENLLHRRNLRRIPVRVHVNGSRGKSSVTRLLAGALNEAGLRTCAKTTGTLARMLLPDGKEIPIFRPSGANILEQRRIVAAAAAQGADALVIECMALQPELQALCEFKLVRATHAVITNCRPDHLEVMGPTQEDVAKALSGMIPPNGLLVTAEKDQLDVLKRVCHDRHSKLRALSSAEIETVTPEEMAAFQYHEHPDNVAVALAVCEALDIDRAVALAGMQKVRPDPGAYSECILDFFGRHIVFCNGFAANDPVSTEQLWKAAGQKHPSTKTKIAVVNCRADRPHRSIVLSEQFTRWHEADHVVLMGTGTYLFARRLSERGYEASRVVFVKGFAVEEIFERVVSLVAGSALIMGMGNVGDSGLALVRHFKNRAQLEAAN